MENFRSTFPLDEAAIARQALRRIFTDPITWAPLVPAVAAYTIFDVPAVFSLGFGAVVLGGVGAYWRKQWSGITDGLRATAIKDHNRAQDAILQAAADELRLGGHAALGAKLGQFLATKRSIENRIHEHGEITAQKIQIEQLVDSLCFGVRDRMQNLVSENPDANQKDAQREIDAAYETLQTTASEIDMILGPGEAPAGGAQSLEDITRRLRDEAEIARRVQARLRAQEAADISAEPPKQESQ